MEQQNNPNWSRGKAWNVGGGVLDGVAEFAMRRLENPEENMLVSVGAAAATGAAWYFLPHLMWAKTAVDMSKSAGEFMGSYKKQQWAKQLSGGRGAAHFGGQFQDNQMAYTTRQRGIQAIQSSKLNARSVLNNEARSLHRF